MADFNGFSQGGTLETARPSAKLAQILDQAAGLEAIDPALVCQLATAAAAAGTPAEWHLSLVNDQGWVTGHGCPPANPRSNRAKADNAGTARITLPRRRARPQRPAPPPHRNQRRRLRPARHPMRLRTRPAVRKRWSHLYVQRLDELRARPSDQTEAQLA